MNQPYGTPTLSEGEEAESGSGERGPNAPAKLTQIEQLILLADASAGSAEGRERAREGLAASLGCTPEDIEEIVADREGGEDAWEQLLVEERVRRGMDSTAMRDVSWDRLEAASLRKLVRMVESDRVNNPGELLAMATKANAAQRGGGRRGQPAPATANQFNMNFYPGSPENGVLPSGNLGVMQMRLSPRARKQIEGRVAGEAGAQQAEGVDAGEEPVDPARMLDSIEMLTLNDVQGAVEEVQGDGGEDEN